MVNKKVTLSLDSKVYDEFQEYCRNHAIMLSKKIELWMIDSLKEGVKKEKDGR